MSIYGGPDIVTDGLVLHLDAGNSKSYSGSGTVWTDLSGNSGNASLINGPTYSSSNRGSIIFDGTNDYSRIASFDEDTTSNALSIFCWIYPTNLSNYSSGGVFFNWIINKRPGASTPRDWQFFSSNSKLGVGIADSSDNFISGNHVTANGLYTLQLNRWQYVGFVTDGTNGGLLTSYYNNNINLQATLTGDRAKRTLNMDIGKAGWDDSFYWTGRISLISIYNKALSVNEVNQNYNALKGRYNL